MTPRFALLGLLALCGGFALTVFLPFLPHMTILVGRGATSVIIAASIAAWPIRRE